MKWRINRVAVLGSGIMGSRIACHFANMGVEVLLLDIPPTELTDSEKSHGLNLGQNQVKNRIVRESFQATIKAKPSPLYHKKFAARIKLGNFDGDLEMVSSADWILEAVIENLEIKKNVYEKVDQYRKPGSIITSNTSGIPIALMTDGRDEDFRRHFCGTHFFNPPRYLRLLEIIPTAQTDPDLVDFLMEYGSLFLGKETVLCKDTPGFIANRIGVYAIMSGMHTIQDMGLKVGEVDRLTGPAIGRPKSATFRTMDLVGLDTTVKVSGNLHEILKSDESRDQFKPPAIVKELYDRKWWGDKTRQGYFKKTKDPKGSTEILELDLQTYEYGPRTKTKFPSLEATKDQDDLAEKLRVLLDYDDKAGEFYRRTFYDLFRYCSFRIPEIADDLYKIDQAVLAGFGWEFGPFKTWDILGVKETAAKMVEAGQKPAPWVYEMLETGAESFFKSDNGHYSYYDRDSRQYSDLPAKGNLIILNNLRNNSKVWGNKGASLIDIGDGVLNLEFHSKMNSIGPELVEGINVGIAKAEENFRALVIGNEAQNFSVGANLALLFMYACDQEFDEINLMIAQFQKTMLRARFSEIPVVAATAGMTLGGGTELSLHCDRIQAHAESYLGLVEVGVGLIPAGGGTKELVLRASDSYGVGDPEYNKLQEYFMNIATAKVSTSAHEAIDMDILQRKDKITVNRSRLIAEAKNTAINLAERGYTKPIPRSDIKVQGRGGMALFEAGIAGMSYGHYISSYDVKIAQKLSFVMNGGDLSYPTQVTEQYLLDLEREAFLSLTGEKKTLERIQSILFKGKTLRN